MASLLSSEFKPVPRDRLYHEKFKYCVVFRMSELAATRHCDHEQVDIRIDHRVKYAEYGRQQQWPRSTMDHLLTHANVIRSHCHDMVDFRKQAKEHHMMISVDWGYFYTNDLSDAYVLANDLPGVTVQKLTCANITHDRGSLRRKNNPFKFRSYFKYCKLEQGQKESLKNYLNAQDTIQMSEGFSRWLNRDTYIPFLRSCHYIDYNNESDITMISLLLPEPFRKTMPIVSY